MNRIRKVLVAVAVAAVATGPLTAQAATPTAAAPFELNAKVTAGDGSVRTVDWMRKDQKNARAVNSTSHRCYSTSTVTTTKATITVLSGAKYTVYQVACSVVGGAFVPPKLSVVDGGVTYPVTMINESGRAGRGTNSTATFCYAQDKTLLSTTSAKLMTSATTSVTVYRTDCLEAGLVVSQVVKDPFRP